MGSEKGAEFGVPLPGWSPRFCVGRAGASIHELVREDICVKDRMLVIVGALLDESMNVCKGVTDS